MQYYLMKQYRNESSPVKWPLKNEIDRIISVDTGVSYVGVDADKDTTWLPYYEKPVFIISEGVRNIFDKYQLFQKVTPIAIGQRNCFPLYIYYPYILDCLHDETEFWMERGPLKRLVLDREKIGYHKVFQIAGILENYLVADMEIVEKLLCAGVYPFEYEEVECR